MLRMLSPLPMNRKGLVKAQIFHRSNAQLVGLVQLYGSWMKKVSEERVCGCLDARVSHLSIDASILCCSGLGSTGGMIQGFHWLIID